MTYVCHLWADCLYIGISSGPKARYRVWVSLYLFYLTNYPIAYSENKLVTYYKTYIHISGMLASTGCAYASEMSVINESKDTKYFGRFHF